MFIVPLLYRFAFFVYCFSVRFLIFSPRLLFLSGLLFFSYSVLFNFCFDNALLCYHTMLPRRRVGPRRFTTTARGPISSSQISPPPSSSFRVRRGGSGQSVVAAELLFFFVLFNSSTKVVEALLPLTSDRLPLLSFFSSWGHTSVGYLIPRALVWLPRLTQFVCVFTTFFVRLHHLLLQWFIQKINAFRVNHHTRRGAPQPALSVSSPSRLHTASADTPLTHLAGEIL